MKTVQVLVDRYARLKKMRKPKHFPALCRSLHLMESPPMFTCCVECFADEELREIVEAEGEMPNAEEDCYFCGSSGRQIRTDRFKQMFARIVDH
jgi:hypothetical protein